LMGTADTHIVMTPVEMAIVVASLAHYEEKFGDQLADQHREAIRALREKLTAM